jgi:ABC-type transport system involved in multi-copper enzyme maturation permease subunit
MLKLMKLEFKKARLRGLLLAAAAANVLLILWCVVSSSGEPGGYADYGIAFAEIGTYVRITFIVFSSVLMARMIVDEYRNKTISVMFTYPVPRIRLFVAKLNIISIFTFVTVLVTNVIVGAAFLLWEANLDMIPDALTTGFLIKEAQRMLIYACAAVGASLIPFMFGMIRKSIPITIVSSFIVSQMFMAIMNRPQIYEHLNTAVVLALAWISIGGILAYLAIRNIEQVDVS